ncbi:glycoside hydrolase family 3 C-terminal domain-containing protein [Actinomadura sp. DC4]|uniref:beta-glucosidase family protein n=1 Tax=Actinomadura sp. DC4 TaxID=3055069 RepID=UPI0025AF53C5|nr:glycoside hydrolase family 3 C-terminal domain-containing protein [Actinomadura sp. DC4]MDN3356453.1 glycoside hydrolase family 3 C-terminal domain-containing protein [Actinomadura sp. DC4]
MRLSPSRTLAAIGALTVGLSLAAAGTGAASPRRGGSPPIAANAPWTATVTWLVGQLTVDEKLLLVHAGTDADPHGEAGYITGVPRLGVPDVRHADAQGVNVFKDATAYPTRLGLAASFDRDALSRFGRVVGDEGRALDVDVLYGPQVDLARLPTWGRNMTTYGEDPYLASELVGREINGIQSQGLLSQVKHFTLYNGQNQAVPSIVDEQTAHELYLRPSEAAVKDGGVSSAMCSYATFQITPMESKPDYACSNGGALNGVLKGQWRFKGWVTSDYGASKATSDLLAGMDQEFVTSNLTSARLKPLVDPASATYDRAYATALDASVARILYQYQRFGLLDDSKYPRQAKTGVRPIPKPPAAVDKKAGIATSRELAGQAAVLLKNDGALPLTGKDTVALIGPTAGLLPAAPGGERARGYGDRNMISPYDAVKQIAGGRATLTPGLDRVGTTVPAAALTTADGRPGLTRTEKDPAGTVIGTKVDASLAGRQSDLTRGNAYTWDGYLDVPKADAYDLWLQRPIGTASGNTSGYNKGINPGLAQGPGTGATGTASLVVDGTAQTLTQPSTILPNTYPNGPSVNGQYLGLTNVGTKLQLAPGKHRISIAYTPAPETAATPTFRFSWAPVQAGITAAATAAAKARTAVVFVDDANTTTTAGDVGSLGADQDALVQAVAAANRDTVVVLNTGGPVKLPWLNSVKGVVEMWYPGQEGGTATADVLYGRVDPAGRLPITFPADATPFTGHPERSVGEGGKITWSEGLESGYRWYTDQGVAPRFPFGYGLSYTTFGYSGLTATAARDGGLDVRLTVRNTGRRTGAAVPQVYLGPSPGLPASIQQVERKLVQFDRVELRPGAARTVSLHVASRELDAWSVSGERWVRGTGGRTVYAGSSATDLPLTAVVRVR